MFARDDLDQETGGRFSRDEGGAVIAALERGGPRIEAESRLLFFRSVAIDAARRDQGLDVSGEIHRGRHGGARPTPDGNGEHDVAGNSS